MAFRRAQNALDPGFHGVPMAQRTRSVMLMVLAWPESGFRKRAAWLGGVGWDGSGRGSGVAAERGIRREAGGEIG
jgi:hypothetical protein